MNSVASIIYGPVTIEVPITLSLPKEYNVEDLELITKISLKSKTNIVLTKEIIGEKNLYVKKQNGTNIYKIGSSKDSKRLNRKTETMSTNKYELLMCCPGSQQLEKRLLKIFENKKIVGGGKELFKFVEEDINKLKEIFTKIRLENGRPKAGLHCCNFISDPETKVKSYCNRKVGNDTRDFCNWCLKDNNEDSIIDTLYPFLNLKNNIVSKNLETIKEIMPSPDNIIKSSVYKPQTTKETNNSSLASKIPNKESNNPKSSCVINIKEPSQKEIYNNLSETFNKGSNYKLPNHVVDWLEKSQTTKEEIPNNNSSENAKKESGDTEEIKSPIDISIIERSFDRIKNKIEEIAVYKRNINNFMLYEFKEKQLCWDNLYPMFHSWNPKQYISEFIKRKIQIRVVKLYDNYYYDITFGGIFCISNINNITYIGNYSIERYKRNNEPFSENLLYTIFDEDLTVCKDIVRKLYGINHSLEDNLFTNKDRPKYISTNIDKYNHLEILIFCLKYNGDRQLYKNLVENYRQKESYECYQDLLEGIYNSVENIAEGLKCLKLFNFDNNLYNIVNSTKRYDLLKTDYIGLLLKSLAKTLHNINRDTLDKNIGIKGLSIINKILLIPIKGSRKEDKINSLLENTKQYL
jgi:hypothetical protein